MIFSLKMFCKYRPRRVCFKINMKKSISFWYVKHLIFQIFSFSSCHTLFTSSQGESIPIDALIENRSSRLVLPKAVLYQKQTYMANGKTKITKQVVSSARGNVVASDFSSRWNGNTLKIPPVSPSILNSDILRVEYFLSVSNFVFRGTVN